MKPSQRSLDEARDLYRDQTFDGDLGPLALRETNRRPRPRRFLAICSAAAAVLAIGLIAWRAAIDSSDIADGTQTQRPSDTSRDTADAPPSESKHKDVNARSLANRKPGTRNSTAPDRSTLTRHRLIPVGYMSPYDPNRASGHSVLRNGLTGTRLKAQTAGVTPSIPPWRKPNQLTATRRPIDNRFLPSLRRAARDQLRIQRPTRISRKDNS